MKKLVLFLFSALILTGCSSEKKTEVTSSQTSAMQITSAPQTMATTTQEKLEMEEFESNITELLPEDYEKERDSVHYSEFEKYTYFSKTAERDTNVNVLLPPDYSEDKEYPVLYILHGFYDNENWMARPVAALNTIYGNLLADGLAEEMIIVLPYIFCDKDMPYCTGMDLDNCLAYDNFINDLETDLMPFIESEFLIAKGRENTAVTGFSMGGREALFIGFKLPEKFGYVGACCPAPGLVEMPGSAMHPGQMTEEEMTFGEIVPYAVLISSSKADGTVGASPDSYRKIMTENNVDFLSHVMEKTGHDHTSVKPHLYNFLQMLFK